MAVALEAGQIGHSHLKAFVHSDVAWYLTATARSHLVYWHLAECERKRQMWQVWIALAAELDSILLRESECLRTCLYSLGTRPEYGVGVEGFEVDGGPACVRVWGSA